MSEGIHKKLTKKKIFFFVYFFVKFFKIPSDRIFKIYQGTTPESLKYLSQKT